MRLTVPFLLCLIPLSFPGGAAPSPAKAPSLSDQLAGLRFRGIGPMRGGRVTAVAGVRGQPLTFYMGATGGGVWKTTDAGTTWDPISDKGFKTGSVGAIAVAESDPNVVYVGMGEAPIRGNVSAGDGVYKSTDAGASWTQVGLKDTQQIARVRVHPRNPDLVYVAAQGHVWGPNPERGIFRSADGGKSWKKVLYVDDKTGACDLLMDPTNPRVLYAAFWPVQRRPWSLESGGPGGGVWKTTDGGDTWKKLAGGLPEGTLGKIGLALSAARPARVFALVEAAKGGLYRSEDGGGKWTLVSDDHRLRERMWYYSWIYADPKNPDLLWAPSVSLLRSNDGGRSFAKVRVHHGDNHDLWIDPDEPARLILGNDGGAAVSVNGGATWSTQDNQPTAQIYRVNTDDRFPYWVYGAQQDNSTIAIPSGVRGEGIDRTDWHPVGGGESGWIAPDPRDPEIVYAGSYGGYITRYDHRTGETRNIIAWPQVIDGQATRDLRYRFQWTAPILVSRHDPRVLYHAAQKLLRSRDEGQTWEEASPDLTRNDLTKQGYSGGSISHEITGVEVYDTIFAIAESLHEPGTLWVGSDDGLVHLTRDDGKSWQNVTPQALPEWIRINTIELSPHDKATAYIAATMYQFDDVKPYLYKTNDYGRTWIKIVSGIPDGAFTRSVREDPARRGLLYAGTETGLYVSLDDGGSWQPLQRNLPPVPITDLVVKQGDLVVATQGRAFWILDDLTPLRLWSAEVARAEAYLFPPRPSVRFPSEGGGEDEAPKHLGRNRPNGVIVDYWLKNEPKEGEPLTLEILDGDRVIRSFSRGKKEDEQKLSPESLADRTAEANKEKSLEAGAGLNRFVWDMRSTLSRLTVPKHVYGDFPAAGPKVPLGSYKARLTVGDRTLEQNFEVRSNPGLKVAASDLKAQSDLLGAVRDDLTAIHDAVARLRDVREQSKQIAERAEKIGKPALTPLAQALGKKLDAVEERLINPDIQSGQDSLNYLPKLDFQFAGLAGMVEGADARPTAAALARYDELKAQLGRIQAELREVLERELVDFNRAVREQEVPAVVVAPAQ